MEVFVVECVKCGATGVLAISSDSTYRWYPLHKLDEALEFTGAKKAGYFIGLCPACIRDSRDVSCNDLAIQAIKSKIK